MERNLILTAGFPNWNCGFEDEGKKGGSSIQSRTLGVDSRGNPTGYQTSISPLWMSWMGWWLTRELACTCDCGARSRKNVPENSYLGKGDKNRTNLNDSSTSEICIRKSCSNWGLALITGNDNICKCLKNIPWNWSLISCLAEMGGHFSQALSTPFSEPLIPIFGEMGSSLDAFNALGTFQVLGLCNQYTCKVIKALLKTTNVQTISILTMLEYERAWQRATESTSS